MNRLAHLFERHLQHPDAGVWAAAEVLIIGTVSTIPPPPEDDAGGLAPGTTLGRYVILKGLGRTKYDPVTLERGVPHDTAPGPAAEQKRCQENNQYGSIV